METAVYAGTDGNYYTEWELWRRFESGRWTPIETLDAHGVEVVEAPDSAVVILWPVDERDLPARVDLRRLERGFEVVDRRPNAT